MGYGFALVLGLLGSLHCAAMCGPLMLALPASPGGAPRFLLGRLFYQLGRVLTYVLLGLMAGLVGRSLFLTGLQRGFSVALGLAVLLGFFVSNKISLSAPLVRSVARLKSAMSHQIQQKTFRSLILLGMLNGLLPCGLVYVALAVATAEGSIGSALGFMSLFGLATLPAMLSLSLWGRLLPVGIRWQVRRLIPLGVFGLALMLILRGLGLGIPYLSPDFSAVTPGCCTH